MAGRQDMGLKTRIFGLGTLEHPIMNAAGPRCKTLEEVVDLSRTPVAVVTVGSITVEPRPGNQGDVYHSTPGQFSLNSLGLPNGGIPYYEENLSGMADVVHRASKTFGVSIAGFTPEEYAKLAALAVQGGADMVEVNLGCPNVWQGGKQKRIACFDPGLVMEILTLVGDATLWEITENAPCLVAKVSPFSDPVLLGEIAQVIKGRVDAVTAINTFPNAFAFTGSGRPAISPQFSKGLAGMAGPAMKAIGLGQVLQWRNLLPEDMSVIGAGGVRTGQDVQDYRRVGASAVQIATAHADEGAKAFDRILMEYVALAEAEVPLAP